MRFAQPSVIKCGGVAECCRIAQLTEAATASSDFSVSTIPWSFCPGPGYLATLHIASVIAPNDGEVMVEDMDFDRANPNMRHRQKNEDPNNLSDLRFLIERKIEFTSTRKRMSILVRDPRDNRLKLYVKGADSEI